jgi:hypothetical protein
MSRRLKEEELNRQEEELLQKVLQDSLAEYNREISDIR